MRKVFILITTLVTIISCQKGFVLNSKSIELINSVVNTDEVLEYKLLIDAYYKGDKIKPENVNWSVKDNNQQSQNIQFSDTELMKWKPTKPGSYTISANFTFATKGNSNATTVELLTVVYPSFNYLKSKVIGSYENEDELNPGFKLNFTINTDFTFSASPNINNFSQYVFYKARNTFSNCSINLQSVDNKGKLQGFITLTDSATNTLRTDIIRDLTFSNGYYNMSFKQIYSPDTTQFRFFELNRK